MLIHFLKQNYLDLNSLRLTRQNQIKELKSNGQKLSKKDFLLLFMGKIFVFNGKDLLAEQSVSDFLKLFANGKDILGIG
ncbi:MAG: hypothetical protein COA58_10100 [Bacteroidetes bacterium]|nr:MAG: hypothetical protein COA58_10100 [Bacteroidota bacterium]